ncbi:MAG TPA: cupin-like domain-containing protein, partial [Crinalium sp.]
QRGDRPSSTVQPAEEPLPELSDDWKGWIIENKLRQIPNENLIQTMIRDGIDADLATRAVHTIQADPTFQQQHEATQRLRKLESVLATQRKVSELSSNFGTIERRKDVSKEEFLEQYYATNTPVILTDMMNDWPALSLWNSEFFRTQYGDAEVQIQFGRNSDPDYEVNCNKHKLTIRMRQYVDMIRQGGDSNNYYMVANNGNLDRPELKDLLKDIILPEWLNPDDLTGRAFFWFGPEGSITPLHHDPCNLIMAQIHGRKRWRMISPAHTPLIYNDIGVFSRVDLENPDYEKYPLFKDVHIIETIVNPGEIIFVPVGWWHQVKGLDVSISLSFTNFVFPNAYSYQDPHIRSGS